MNAVVREQQKELASSIGGLREDVDLFSKSLLSYDSTLKAIARATNRNVELFQKSNARLEEELSKKAVLSLNTYKVLKVRQDTLQVYLQIENLGNKIAKGCYMVLEVPSNLDFLAEGWSGSEPDIFGIRMWTFPSVEPMLSIPISPQKEKPIARITKHMNFKIKVPANIQYPLNLHYTLFHDEGYNQGILAVEP